MPIVADHNYYASSFIDTFRAQTAIAQPSVIHPDATCDKNPACTRKRR